MFYRFRVVPPDGAPPFETEHETESVVIGRSSDADLTIADQAVSRRHARLWTEAGQAHLEDLDSNNGTWLGKRRVTGPTHVRSGQVIRLAAGQARKGSAFEIHILSTPEEHSKDASIQQKGLHKDALEVLEEASALPSHALDEAELRAYVERFHLLNGVHAMLGRQISEEQLLDIILDRVFAHLEPDAGIIYLQNQDGELELAARRAEAGYQHEPLHSKTLIHELMDEGKALLFNDVKTESLFDHSESLHGARVRSLLATPLMDREGTLGMLVLYSRSTLGRFREQDLELVVQLAAIATLRIRNLRLTDLAANQLMDLNRILNREVEKRTQELVTLDRIVATINREHELGKVLAALLEHGFVLFPEAERGSILIWEPAREAFVFAVTRGFDEEDLNHIALGRDQALARYARTGSEIAHGVFLQKDFQPPPGEDLFAHLPKVRCLLAMTLEVDGAVRGILALGNGSEPDAFSSDDGDMVSRYRDHATAALARALLLERLEDAHQERLRVERQVLIQKRRAMLAELGGGVAHEVNNANNQVVQNAAALAARLTDFQRFLFALMEDSVDESIRVAFADKFTTLERDLTALREGSDRIDNYVRDLQLMLEVRDEPARPTDLYACLEATSSLARPVWEDIEIELVAPDEPVTLSCSASAMTRVFAALINNAGDAIRAREGEAAERVGRIEIGLSRSGSDALVWIEDNGVGIPEEVGDQVFRPSVTSRPDIRLGLGLSVCADLVEEHGGKIELESEVGKGTRVLVRLPM